MVTGLIVFLRNTSVHERFDARRIPVFYVHIGTSKRAHIDVVFYSFEELMLSENSGCLYRGEGEPIWCPGFHLVLSVSHSALIGGIDTVFLHDMNCVFRPLSLI